MNKFENAEKFKQWKETGDPAIREEIIIGNMHLAKMVANDVAAQYNLDRAELTQYAYEALISSVDTFDENLGYAFSTYAVKNIYHYFERCYIKILGMKGKDFVNKYIAIKSVLDEENESDNFADIILDSLVNENIISAKYKWENLDRIHLINTKLYDECDNFIRSNLDLFTKIEYRDLQKLISSLLDDLPLDEKKILMLRYGFIGDHIETLRSISKIFNTSRETIRKKEANALRKLRFPSRWKKIKDFLENDFSLGKNEDYLDTIHNEISNNCLDENYYMFFDPESYQDYLDEQYYKNYDSVSLEDEKEFSKSYCKKNNVQ